MSHFPLLFFFVFLGFCCSLIILLCLGVSSAHIDVRLGLEGAEAALLVGGHALGESGPVDRGLGDTAGGHSAQILQDNNKSGDEVRFLGL